MLKIGKLKIHSSFFFFMALIIALGHTRQFFLLVLATTAHELAHVVVARLLGLGIDSFVITPIGEIAYIKDYDGASAKKKYAILTAGAAANFILAVLFRGSEFMYFNLSIGLFNILPVYPLDGGKLLHTFLGNRIGILRSIKFVKLFTKIGIALLFAAGIMQVILYPLNISLFAISLFLASIYSRERNMLVFSFYKCMMAKGLRLKGGMRIKEAAFTLNSTTEEIRQVFTWDYFHLIYIVAEGEIRGVYTEEHINSLAAEGKVCVENT